MPELQFDRTRLDLDRREATVADQPMDLQPLVFDLLCYLARHPRRVVTKSELLSAVWRTSFVSDSVVARAIMKARRAIQDDAAAPRVLRTLPRAGYLLDAEVVERAAPPAAPRPALTHAGVTVAILPFQLLSAPTELQWLGQGLTGLLHHLLERSTALVLAPAQDVGRAWAQRSPGEDPLAFACERLGVGQAVYCEVTISEGSFELQAKRGAAMSQAACLSLSGTDAFDLVRQLANTFEASRVVAAQQGDDTFWHEQLARAICMQQSGQQDRALTLLEVCLPELHPSTSLDLLHARLLQQNNRLDSACALITQAVARVACPDTVTVQLLALRGQCHYEADQLLPALEDFEHALRMADGVAGGAMLRPDILVSAANVRTRMGEAQHAIDLTELAAAEADHLGVLDIRARSWLMHAAILVQMDRLHRGERAAQTAIELAHRSGDPEHQARSWRLQANLQTGRRRYTSALISIRRSIALWVRSGLTPLELWARLMEAAILLESDRLGELDARLLELGRRPDLQNAHRLNHDMYRAMLHWRAGDQAQGMRLMEAISQPEQRPRTLTHLMADSELVFMWVHLQQLDAAELALQRIQDLPVVGKLARCQAALALARGERAAAIRLLMTLWRTGSISGSEGPLIIVDLTWLLLEDARPGFEDPELESLFAHLLDVSEEILAARLVRAGYLLRQRADAHQRRHWQAALASSPIPVQRCPALAAPGYQEALAQGRPPRLPELISRICW